MPAKKKDSYDQRSAIYDTVLIDDLQKTRRGKHHDFVAGVLADLEILKAGSAIKIPLKELDDVSVLKVRSAINRASAAKGLKISTSSDAENFYVWRQKD